MKIATKKLINRYIHCIDTIRHGVSKPSARLTCIPLITPISKESELKVEVLVA